MRNRILFLFVFIILSAQVFAQTAPDTLWTKTYGGSNQDGAYSVQLTSDGGFIIAGYTNSYGAGNSDFWLIKTDENGDEEWNQTYGGSGIDEASSVQQTIDGGYIVAGNTRSFETGDYDFWLVKTDENGDEVWNQTYGGNGIDKAHSVQQTIDGGYIVAGNTTSYGAGYYDFWLVKTDENGNEEWNHTYGGDYLEQAYSVQQTTDGGYIIAGWTDVYGEFLLVKTDENGIEVWNQTYGGVDFARAHSVQQTTDGGYIIAGQIEFENGDCEFYLVKTDENGNEEWNQTYAINSIEVAYSVKQTIDNGYIIAGLTLSYETFGFDFWLVKTDVNGNEEWNQSYGGDEQDFAMSIQQTLDGGYVIAGFTESYGAGESDFWLIRLGPEISIANNTIAKSLISNLSNYPNPFNPTTTISFNLTAENAELIIYNIKGQKVKDLSPSLCHPERVEGRGETKYSVIWDGTDENNQPVSSGIYFYKLNINGKSESVKKCLLLK